MIILASASPRRKELLEQIGCRFKVVTSAAEEDKGSGLSPEQLVMKNALIKAKDVAKSFNDDIVLGADTIVYMQGRIYGKPQDVSDAKQMLRTLAGKKHEVYTGIAIVKGMDVWQDFVKTSVKLVPLTENEICTYVATGEPMDKAGAYAIQGKASIFVEGLEGCYTNVVGLPLNCLANLCKKAGIDLL